MKKSSILIVEDERITAEDLKITLEKLGYAVTGIVSGAADLYQILRQHTPDLILMDIYLKGDKDGIELATEIKDTYRIPVIYLTAYSDTSILERAKISTPFGYILKPFQERELHSNIEMALYKHSSEQRINHLNSLLKAIRDVNQLIVRVGTINELLKKTCETIISTQAYSSAWFVALNLNGEYLDAASAGMGEVFDDFTELLKNGYQPSCFKVSNASKISAYSPQKQKSCSNCMLKPLYPDNGTLVARVSYQSQLYGYLAVSMPYTMINDKEELLLFDEIADDLGLALNNIRQQNLRLQAEDALRESEILFRHAFDYAANSMALLNTEGRFLRCNNAFENLLGYTENELLSMRFEQLTHPDDINLMPELVQGLIQGKHEKVSFEKRCITSKNQLVWAYISLSAIRDNTNAIRYFIIHLLDLTERRHAEENLRDSEEQYRTFMNSASDVACIKDSAGKYLIVNDKMANFIGKTQEEICGKTIGDFFENDIARTFADFDRKVLKTRLSVCFRINIHGQEYDVNKFYVKLKNNNSGTGTFMRNITSQVQALAAIENKSAELERFNNLMLGRELKMIELKKEINNLLIGLGRSEKYKLP
jgi:PAS domain S-box-containing protein